MIRYAQAHGGATIGVMSQSSAAAAIVQSGANIAGLGGFGDKSTVAPAANEVTTGHLRWIVTDGTGGGRLPGDTRTGSQSAFTAAAKACKAVSVSSTGGQTSTMYDCSGRGTAILRAGAATA